MPSPLPLDPEDGIIVEFTFGDVTLAPSGAFLKVTLDGFPRLVRPDHLSDVFRAGLSRLDDLR